MQKIESYFSSLRLSGMAQAWQSLTESRQHQSVTLSEGLELLLDAEVIDREQKRTKRLHHNASFRYQASIEEFKYDTTRGLDRSLILHLSTCQFITKGESILITGSTGCGKSFIATALGHQACAMGYKVSYYNVQKLMMKTKIARADGSVGKLFEKIAKSQLLILDDFGLTHLDKNQQLDLMEMVEDRHGKASTIIASQLPVASWFDIIGEETIADAILDRLVHTSHRIELKGNSLRKKL